jgi:class 3 adenylate cyclase
MSIPEDRNLLVAFFDLTGYHKWVVSVDRREIFTAMAELFDRAARAIEKAGGTLVKAIGDAGLATFPEERAEEGILALMALRDEADRWLQERRIHCRMTVKVHFGPVACGPVAGRFDVYGETVNTAATLVSHGVSITPQAFRRLSSAGRRRFKKHTPPVRYIAIEDRHRE